MDDSEVKEFSTRTEAAYARLREDILAGALKPSQKLRLDSLRNNYGFGLSSLREALSKLSSERLVRTTGQRGYWVEPISLNEFRDITRVRLLLEPQALEWSIEAATPEWEAQLTEAYQRLDQLENSLDSDREGLSKRWDKENTAFHQALIRNCGSDWMQRFVATIIEQSERYRRQGVTHSAIPKEVLRAEHKTIFDAAIARQGRLAAELLRVHISNSAEKLEATVF